ncbi:MAG: response regulator transcription factor [Campylobacterota bacterium]|nr:response regulator transcription factor [Campylobacterota bacterium]
MRILLLEDDQILCQSLQEYLESEGFHVDTAIRGEEVFDLSYENHYDLYIFDINVPDVNGFDVLKLLKESGDTTPAIYITALTDVNSLSKGFEMGADDYIKKPFDPEELVIRIKSKYLPDDQIIYYKELTYDPINRLLKRRDEIIILGEVQLSLLHLLITRIGEIVNSFELMDILEQPNANALRVNLTKLKNKLHIDIKNIRGQGYMIEKI